MEKFNMLKTISTFLSALLLSAAALAAVDVNKGTAADLDGVKGLGPAKTKQILEERKKGDFKSWDDLISRVKGMGEKTAAKLSTEGLTVGGAAYKGAAAKAETKPAAKAVAAAPAATATAAAKAENANNAPKK